jgi:hypothetical protein
MIKKELEKEILDLKAKVAALEARPICYGCHYCNCGCHHGNWPNTTPLPWQPNTNPIWISAPNTICGTTTGGLVDKNAETTTFGKVNS